VASVGLRIFRSSKTKTSPKDSFNSLRTALCMLLCGTKDLVKLREELPEESGSVVVSLGDGAISFSVVRAAVAS